MNTRHLRLFLCPRLPSFAPLGSSATWLFAMAAMLLMLGPPLAASDVRTWYYEGVVVDSLSDPGTLLSDVQVGDVVRGYISYDLAIEDASGDPAGGAGLYIHPSSFEVLSMVLHNPRTGSDVALQVDPDAPGSEVYVFDDLSDVPGGDPTDGLLVYQFVTSPQGSLGFEPLLFLTTDGPSDNWSGIALPAELELSDWPHAYMLFLGEFNEFSVEITSLSAVVPEPATLTLLTTLGVGVGIVTSRRRRAR